MPATQRFESRGRFKAPPEALWPLIADTAAMNRAIGLPPIHYEITPREGEHPFPNLVPKAQPPDRTWEIAGRLLTAGCQKEIVDLLCQHIALARDEDVARMRPFELADRWGHDRRTTLGVFLQATVGGL